MPNRSDKTKTGKKKNPAAVALGRLGGPKGGIARAKSLSAKRRMEISRKASAARMTKISPERRKEIARIAVKARWNKKKQIAAGRPLDGTIQSCFLANAILNV